MTNFQICTLYIGFGLVIIPIIVPIGQFFFDIGLEFSLSRMKRAAVEYQWCSDVKVRDIVTWLVYALAWPLIAIVVATVTIITILSIISLWFQKANGSSIGDKKLFNVCDLFRRK